MSQYFKLNKKETVSAVMIELKLRSFHVLNKK